MSSRQTMQVCARHLRVSVTLGAEKHFDFVYVILGEDVILNLKIVMSEL